MEEIFRRVDEAYGGASGAELERRLLDIDADVQRRFGPESREAASMASELGGFYRGQQMLERSETRFRRAMEILEKLGLECSGDYATVVNNLGGTYRYLRRYDEAEDCFRRCRELYRETVGTKHILYAAALNNLSLVKLDRGELEDARALLAEAGEILSALPERRDEYVTSLVNLGVLSLRCGAAEDAEKSLTEAVRLFRTEPGLDRYHYHAALNALSCAHEALHHPAEALACAHEALEAAQRIYGPEHPEVKALAARAAKLREERI